MVYTLQSNSRGNCIILNFDNKFKFALDLGVSVRRITNYLTFHQLYPLDYAFLSHEHVDHVQGVAARGVGVLIGSARTLEAANVKRKALPLNKWTKLSSLLNVKVYTFATIHRGAVAPRGLVLKVNKCKVVYLTDTSYVWNKHMKNAQLYFIEANYGAQLLPQNSAKLRRQAVEVAEHLTLKEAEAILVKAKAWKAKYIQLTHMNEVTDETLLKQLAVRLSPAEVSWPKPMKIKSK